MIRMIMGSVAMLLLSVLFGFYVRLEDSGYNDPVILTFGAVLIGLLFIWIFGYFAVGFTQWMKSKRKFPPGY